MSNYSWIAKQAFQSDDVNVEEMTERLIQSVEHYSRSTASAPNDFKQGKVLVLVTLPCLGSRGGGGKLALH